MKRLDRQAKVLLAAITRLGKTWSMPKAVRSPSFDGLFKFGAMLGTLVTAAFGIWQYADTAHRAAIQPFLQERMQNCMAVSGVTAAIAAPADGPTESKQQIEFWRLYFGPLAVVEDAEVEDKMVRFGQLLRAVPDVDVQSTETRSYGQQLSAGVSVDSSVIQVFQMAALDVSHACRGMVSDDFRLHLPLGLDKLYARLSGATAQ